MVSTFEEVEGVYFDGTNSISTVDLIEKLLMYNG